jgi:hypothetical protein
MSAIASAHRWGADGAVGWLIQAPGVEPSTGEAVSRGERGHHHGPAPERREAAPWMT